MGAYLKICEGGTYSEKQYFVFFTAVFKEYTGSKCLYNCCTQKKIKVYNKSKRTTYHVRKRVWSFKLLKQQGYGKFNQRNRTYETLNTGLVLEEEKKQ